MNIKVTLQRIDGTADPVTFEESRFPSIVVARETYAKGVENFNMLAKRTGQSQLTFVAEMVPPPPEAHATLSPKEAARAAAAAGAAPKRPKLNVS